jgi:hypothetical protein
MELAHAEKQQVVGPRKEAMVRLEIDVVPSHQMIPPGITAPHGVHTVKVFASDVPLIMALVEPDQSAVARAEQDFRGTLDDMIREATANLTELEAQQEAKKIAATFAGSPAAMFQRNMRRDMLPLRSCRVVEEGLPAPSREAGAESEERIARIVAQEVARAMSALVEALGVRQSRDSSHEQGDKGQHRKG